MDILELLKQKRQEIADREEKEDYKVFPYPTLKETVRVMPKTKAELANIKGWGPKRIAAYGDEVIYTIQNPTEAAQAILATQKDIPQEQERATLTVSQFLVQANRALFGLGNVEIQGEISDVSIRQEMAFFDLKDTSGKECVIKCFVGSWQFGPMSHLIEAGLEVVIQGAPRIFERRGTFSITVRSIKPVGEGALKKEFEALKKKLEEKGYFDPARKRPIPKFVQRIGLITSAEGDAVNDFRRNLGEYGFVIGLIDVRVEGEYAEEAIERAFKTMNTAHPDLDVIVLIRGGGGLENLKAFNSERVAEAIIGSRIPVITGVGHERDFTIVDFVSDYRASTPTGTAVFLRTERESLIAQVDAAGDELKFTMERTIERTAQSLTHSVAELTNAFARTLEQKKLAIVRLGEHMQYALSRVFEKLRGLAHTLTGHIHEYEAKMQQSVYRIATLQETIHQRIEKRIEFSKNKLDTLSRTLETLSPEGILKRGYSLAYTKDGTVIRDATQLQEGDTFGVRVEKGRIQGVVKKVESVL